MFLILVSRIANNHIKNVQMYCHTLCSEVVHSQNATYDISSKVVKD